MTETPDSVTRRGVQEVLRSFARSDWTGMTLEIDGLRITVGKNGPPAGAAPTSTAPAELQHSHVAATSRQEGGSTAIPGSLATPLAARRSSSPAPVPPPSVDTTGLVEVRSPAVGAFWVAPSPGQAPFVEVGQVVAEHEQLAIVEVMKLMNPVVAPQAGEVVHVLATNAEMVEYDQVLFLIRPADA